jgi:hypothetical protein
VVWNRAWIIGFAVVLAALLLLATLWVDSSPPAAPKPATIEGPVPEDLLRGFDPSKPDAAISPTGQARKYRFNSVNSRGQLVELFGDLLTPQPHGVTQVTMPGIRVHFAPRRMLEMLAERGQIVAPDEQPRSGQFDGSVVLTLYQRGAGEAPGAPVDRPAEASGIVLRLFLQDAAFDLDLGRIETDKLIHLTGPRLDFRGVGLKLSYNALRNRIDRLEVEQGKVLRLKPGGAGEGGVFLGDGVQTPPDAGGAGASQGSVVASRSGVQYYRATLTGRVRILRRDVTIDAGELRVLFCVDPGRQREQMLGAAGAEAGTGVRAHRGGVQAAGLPIGGWLGGALSQVAVAAWAQSPEPASSVPLGLPQDRSMAPFEADDVIVTWNGPLVVEPIDAEQAGGFEPSDLRLEIVGEPVTVTLPKRAVLTAQRVQYRAREDRAEMIGSQAYPLTVDAPQLGRLTGQKLVFQQAGNLIQVVGPGRLSTADAMGGEATAALEASSERAAGAPDTLRGVSVSWSEGLSLTFRRPAQEAPASDPARLGADAAAEVPAQAVETAEGVIGPAHQADERQTVVPRGRLVSAVFNGEVAMRHPRLDLDCDRLGLFLDDQAPAEASLVRGLRTASASGAVRVTLRPNSGGEDGSAWRLGSNDLWVQLKPDPTGGVYPAQILASGQVKAQRSEDRLTADRLELTLEPSVAAPAGKPSGDLEWRTATAEGDVTVGMQKPAVHVEADRVLAETGGKQLQFFGTATKPARVVQSNGSIVAAHLVLNPDEQKAHVPGPGTLTLLLNSPPSERIAAKGAAEPAPLTVTWTQGMGFDSAHGVAQFAGNVVASTQTQRETARLSANDLWLQLGEAAGSSGSVSHAALSGGGRSLATLTARQNVVFLFEGWADRPGGTLRSRVRLGGPLLNFDRPTGQLQVVGRGTLLVEDYHSRSSEVAAGASTSAVELAGAGATLFTWAGELVWDGGAQRVRLSQGVQMLHRPLEPRQPVQLDCQQLVAAVATEGGLDGWFVGREIRPRVQAVFADHDVRVLVDQREIRSDHLRYSGDDRTVLVHADEGRMTQVYDRGQPTPLSAQALRWDLTHNRFEIIQPGRAGLPVR